MSLLAELKRRNVFRVGLAYVLMAWVLLQGADFVLDLIGAPEWVIRALAVVVAIGLPIALFFAWAFEMTPEGIKREHEVDRTQSIAPQTGRKLDRAIIVFLAAALVLVLAERFFLAGRPTAPEPGADPARAEAGLPAPSDKSIAVLPFADLSQSGDQAWFADGLAEEILNALVRVPDLQVAARTSSFQYRDTTLSVPEIGNELGVAHVLEGSVRSAGERIRVTAQLIRSKDGFHVWSENYDRDQADMIGIQEDLAKSIAVALETSMDPEALAAMARVGTRSIAAYQEYLKGLTSRQTSLSSSTDSESYKAAYEHFERARELDPEFSSAHILAADFWKVQLSLARLQRGLTEQGPRESLSMYHERIDAAIRQARSELERKRILADQAEIDTRFGKALELYLEYLSERPNDDDVRYAAANLAFITGDKELFRDIISPWRERGLTDSVTSMAYMTLAYKVLDPSDVADFGLRALERWPNDLGLLYQVHRALLWANRRLEASRLADRHRRLEPDSPLLLEVREACAAGDRETAEDLLSNLDLDSGAHLSDYWMAYHLLGHQQAVIDALAPIDAEGVPYRLGTLLTYQQFDPRPYPNLMAVLEREGIERPAPVTPPFACPPPEKTSVAVLAFENMSPDPENEFFADGISEEILNVLAGFEDLRVIARTSAFSFKGSGATIAEIARKLGVSHVLEGSVRRSGKRVRVTAQLIETDGESHLWSETYDRDLDDIFAVQDEIARAITDELQLQLTDDERERLVVAPTDNLEAYNWYLQGRQLWHSRGEENLRTSARLLQQAVDLDPQFAEAWAALADAWVLIPEYATSRSVETVPAARDAVNRALELDPDMPQALTTRAYIRFMYDYDWDNAERDFKRAIELDPGYATAQQWYGEYLAVRYRDIDGGLAQFRKAAELDPLAPVMWNVSGWAAMHTGRLEEGIGYFRRALEIEPGFDSAYANMMFAYLQLGDYETARDMWRRAAALADEDLQAGYDFIDAVRDPTARQPYLEAMADNPFWRGGAMDRALGYMLLGDRENALLDMIDAQENGYPYAAHVNFIRLYDVLRDDPRYQAHLAAMNLWPPEQ